MLKPTEQEIYVFIPGRGYPNQLSRSFKSLLREPKSTRQKIQVFTPGTQTNWAEALSRNPSAWIKSNKFKFLLRVPKPAEQELYVFTPGTYINRAEDLMNQDLASRAI